MIHSENEATGQTMPDANLASYWLWLGVMLLLLVAGRATNRPVMSRPTKPPPATITRPNPNEVATQHPQLISTFVNQ